MSKNIPIVMATDENYVYPTIVAITSILKNANETTNYKIIIMHPTELSQNSKDNLISLNSNPVGHTIILYDMKDDFKECSLNSYATTPAYYRFKMASILSDELKCIYLDSDTLILKDLTEMYSIDIENYYVGAVPDYPRSMSHLKAFGVKNDRYICDGVMVVNLFLFRQDSIEQKLTELASDKQNNLLSWNDQDIINIICYDKIFDLDLKFGIFGGMLPGGYLERWAKKYFDKDQYNRAINDPSIIHYVWKKPWQKNQEPKRELWWEYAEKTKFYEEICKKYKNN